MLKTVRTFANLYLPTRSDKFLRKALLTLFILSWLYYSAHALISARQNGSWVTGDWLISYAGGFQRRGLLGSILILASDLTGTSPVTLTYFSQVIIAATFFLLLFKFLTRQNTPVLLLMLAIAPMGTFYFLSDPAVVGRKEIFFYIACLLWLEHRSKYSGGAVVGPKEIRSTLVLTAYFVFVTLTHEGFIFFVPLLLIPVLYSSEIGAGVQIKTVYISLLPLAGAFMTTLVLLSFPGQSKIQMCNALVQRGVSDEICSGAITAASNSGSANPFIYFPTDANLILKWFLSYAFVFIVLIALLVAYLSNNSITKHYVKLSPKTAMSLVGLTLWTLPIYVIAVDWGRFISIFFTIVSLCYIQIEREFQLAPRINASTRYKKSSTNSLAASQKLLLFLFPLLFGVSSVGGEYSSIVESAMNQFLRIFELLASETSSW